MAIFTEDDPRSPGPVAHPGAFTPGWPGADMAAEYGGPPARGGLVVFTPQYQPGRDGQAGEDERPPSLGDIVGPAPAISEVRR